MIFAAPIDRLLQFDRSKKFPTGPHESERRLYGIGLSRQFVEGAAVSGEWLAVVVPPEVRHLRL